MKEKINRYLFGFRCINILCRFKLYNHISVTSLLIVIGNDLRRVANLLEVTMSVRVVPTAGGTYREQTDTKSFVTSRYDLQRAANLLEVTKHNVSSSEVENGGLHSHFSPDSNREQCSAHRLNCITRNDTLRQFE